MINLKLTINQIKEIKEYPNSIYDEIKIEFVYNSNKIEGSSFTKDELIKCLKERIIEGSHEVRDVFRTINSLNLFDFVVDTLGEPLTKTLILEFHSILKKKGLDEDREFAGCWKKIPNMITGSPVQIALPWEIDSKMYDLLNWWGLCKKGFEEIIRFHSEFKKVYPLQDENGSVARLIMLKQCIESNIDLIVIDEQYDFEYKIKLAKSQMSDNYEELEKVLRKCQNFLEEKNELLTNTLKCLENCK